MEVPPFKPSQLRLLYQQVAEHIALRIDAGDLPRGSRVPPERELAQEYSVAYHTIRRAMGVLRDRGLIVTIHGRGTFVAEK